jgi:hypothetical protein
MSIGVDGNKDRVHNSITMTTTTYQADRIAKLEAAIRHWEACQPKLEGEHRLVENTLRELRARREALR